MRDIMKIEIYYCSVWNYKPTAASLAEELRDELNTEAKLIPGKRGIFDVVVDGKTVFSKFNTSRFPSSGEVANKIKKLR